MSRRIEIEITSVTNGDTSTWRAAGAREPKGTIANSLLPGGTEVGAVLRVDAEFFVDGIEIVGVLPPKGERKEPDFLEIVGSGRNEGGVTTSLVKGSRGGRDRDRDGDGRGRGKGRRDRNDRGRGRGDTGGRSDRPDREGRNDRDGRGGGDRRPRRERPERAPAPQKPKAKRLRPRREHRNAVLADLPEMQKPIAEQVLRGGVPGVRKLIEEQNAQNTEADRPVIDPAPLVQLAEDLLPRLKAAEWHDRADAAIAGIADVDLRDLRSVVVAAESAARTEETRALADEVREALAKRVDDEHNAWLKDIADALTDDRTVRALRMSSRPPKAGAPLPLDLATRLTEAANASLSDDTGPQRWGTVLDAVAFSPVRQNVIPAGIPSRPNDELLETVKKLSTRVPTIAGLFGIEPTEVSRGKRRRPRKRSNESGQAKPIPPKPSSAPEAVKAAADVSAPADAEVADSRASDQTAPAAPTPTEAPVAASVEARAAASEEAPVAASEEAPVTASEEAPAAGSDEEE